MLFRSAQPPPAPNRDTSIQWLDPEQGENVLDAILAGYADYFEAVRRDPTDVDAIFRAFNAFRVLCAVRDGPSGVGAFNEQVTRRGRQVLAALAPDQTQELRSPWYAGRPVMVLRNDYVLKLFNGDIGIALPAGDVVAVLFPDGDNGMRGVPIARMPPHETAFATTVHKAQGSEFDSVFLVLPRNVGPTMSMELLYTGVTRARGCVNIFANPEVLSRAMAFQSRRYSGMLARFASARE